MQDVVYDGVCIRNSPNPIFFDTGYTAAGVLQGNRLPTYKDITFKDVNLSGGGAITFNGYSSDHRIGVTLEGVVITDAQPYSYSIRHADFHVGPGPMNLQLKGSDTTVTGKASAGETQNCATKFVPFAEGTK